MKNHTRGVARSGRHLKVRASYAKAKTVLVQSLLFFNLISFSSIKVKLSAPQQSGGKFALSSIVIPLGALCFALMMVAAGARQPHVSASSFSEGVSTSEDFAEGALISLLTTEPADIELADVNTANYLMGVVEPEGEGLLVSDVEGSNVYVATSGVTKALVSDLNGEIKTGDFVGASWIKGVGMKALKDTENDQKILGVALQDQDFSNSYTYEVDDVKTSRGVKTARIGRISIKIFPRDIGPYSEAGGKSSIEKFASNIVGKDVPLFRVLAALLLFGVAVVMSGVFMTNGIKGSLTSIGRNPLASQSIFASLTQISVVSVGLILVGAAVSYVVLVI